MEDIPNIDGYDVELCTVNVQYNEDIATVTWNDEVLFKGNIPQAVVLKTVLEEMLKECGPDIRAESLGVM